MPIRSKLIAGMAVTILAFIAGWVAQGWRFGGQIAMIERDHAMALSKAQASARLKEQEYAKLYSKVDRQYIELAEAQLEVADLRAAVAAGNQRLSVRTSPGSCGVSGDTSATSLDNETPRADIDPGDAEDIIAILARGDEAIRQLNALQDWASMLNN